MIVIDTKISQKMKKSFLGIETYKMRKEDFIVIVKIYIFLKHNDLESSSDEKKNQFLSYKFTSKS